MNPYELPAMLEDELPAIGKDLRKTNIHGGVNSMMKIFTGYTRKMLSLHDLPSVIQCMNVAEKIYHKGNQAVKNAIENVFIYSFSGWRCICDKAEWQRIKAGMPATLYAIYVMQVCKSGL